MREPHKKLHLKSLIYGSERKSTKCEAFSRLLFARMTNIAFYEIK